MADDRRMTSLQTQFDQRGAIAVALDVPATMLRIMDHVAQIIGTDNLCVAGGFARGLWIKQHLRLDAKINDIDLFIDVPVEKVAAVRGALEAAFGTPHRFHTGTYGHERGPRGLLEFALPPECQPACAGATSLQLNYGPGHEWAYPALYTSLANVGINQIAIERNGHVFVSPAFLQDMHNRTMTMNQDRHWTANDWDRTTKKIREMLTDRPEFAGWTPCVIPRPAVVTSGTFWDAQMQQAGLAPKR